MKIGIFCSANNNLDAEFSRLTEEFGHWIGGEGHTIVYGGRNSGLMECIARSVKESGGMVVGVVPQVLLRSGRVSDFIDVTIPCDDLSDRKSLMMAHSDVFIALPGGVGTLDEIFSVVASASIGYHDKRVILYNIRNFWQPLAELLEKLQRHGVLREGWRENLVVADSLDEIIRML